MRIYGNRKIITLPGQTVRPTPARAREALFNIWRDRVPESHWLDLCAGNGTMGAEALCRGAAAVTGLECWGKAARVVRQNWQNLAKPEQKITVLRGNVTTVQQYLGDQQFDLIYFDPPYAAQLYDPVLKAIAAHQLLKPSGAIAAEYSPKQWQPQAYEGLEQVRQKVYGNTAIAFYEVSLP